MSAAGVDLRRKIGRWTNWAVPVDLHKVLAFGQFSQETGETLHPRLDHRTSSHSPVRMKVQWMHIEAIVKGYAKQEIAVLRRRFEMGQIVVSKPRLDLAKGGHFRTHPLPVAAPEPTPTGTPVFL